MLVVVLLVSVEARTSIPGAFHSTNPVVHATIPFTWLSGSIRLSPVYGLDLAGPCAAKSQVETRH